MLHVPVAVRIQNACFTGWHVREVRLQVVDSDDRGGVVLLGRQRIVEGSLGHPCSEVVEPHAEVEDCGPDGLGVFAAGAFPHFVVDVQDDRHDHVDHQEHHHQDEGPGPDRYVPVIVLSPLGPIKLTLHADSEARSERRLQRGEAFELAAKHECAADDIGYERRQGNCTEVYHVSRDSPHGLRQERKPRLGAKAHEESEHQDDDVVVQGDAQVRELRDLGADCVEKLFDKVLAVVGKVPTEGTHFLQALRDSRSDPVH
mmetsp:Transcript_15961/g.37328  ORF Transcript_15961/g.37328 Transcript_15961/m.37328 type:complete len:258 (-) Transcript_15961:932-1705(-)